MSSRPTSSRLPPPLSSLFFVSALLLSPFVLAMGACDSAAEPQGSSAGSDRGPTDVDGSEARRLVAEENAFLLDVRSDGEFQGEHIDGATNIPIGELPARLSEVPADRPVVVYCLSGGRSATAAATLSEAGRRVYDLGGIGAW